MSIKIKESKKGTFTAAATKHDKGVQEFARQVLSNKENYSPAMVKKANFARNASKWKKEMGGFIESLIPDVPELLHGGQIYSEKVKVGKFKNPAEILRDMINDGTLKNFSVKENVPKQNFGGAIQTVAPLADLALPGLGTGLSLLGSLFDEERNKPEEVTYNKQLRKGGEVNGFKQYNAPMHEQGGQLIGKDGEPNSNNGVAEIEGSENSFKYNTLPEKAGHRYVFSDANGTSSIVRGVISKYKNKNTDFDAPTRAAMEMEVKNVEQLNEAINTARQQVSNYMQMRYGGKTQYKDGDRLVVQPPELTNPYDVVQTFGSTNGLVPMTQDRNLPTPYSISETKPDYSDKTSNDFYTVGANQNVNQGDNLLDNTPGSPQMEEGKVAPDYGKYLRTAGIVASGIDAFQKPAFEETILPDYSKSDERMNAMTADLTQARQDVLAGANRGSELNRGAASSYSQYRSRELSNIGNLQDQLGRIGAQEQQMRNQILGAQGQYEATKATTIAGIQDAVAQRNLANKARVQDLRKQFFADIVHEGDRLSTIRNRELINQAKIEEGMQILKMVAPDFQINDNQVKNIIKVAGGQIPLSDLSNEELVLFTRLNGK